MSCDVLIYCRRVIAGILLSAAHGSFVLRMRATLSYAHWLYECTAHEPSFELSAQLASVPFLAAARIRSALPVTISLQHNLMSRSTIVSKLSLSSDHSVVVLSWT